MKTISEINLQSFYPENLKIQRVEESEDEITLHMRSVSKSSACIRCGSELHMAHGSHRRKVQDLPILGKRVMLSIQIKDYQCTSEACKSFASPEAFHGFIEPRSRMTERLIDFITMLATETSCESAARIMQAMKVRVSGDTVIRLLLRRYAEQPAAVCGSAIGIDDFAFKKRHSYGTIIVDGATHRPVALLEGRDGSALKEWLNQNKHVTAVTRDRASAYAKAVAEILPDAMQIADRFHLHQNLLEAVRNTVKAVVPADIKVPLAQAESDGAGAVCHEEVDKKNLV